MKAQSSSPAAFRAEDFVRLGPSLAQETGDPRSEPNAALSKLLQAAGDLDRRPPLSPVVVGGGVRLLEAVILAMLAGGLWLGHGSEDRVATALALTGVATTTTIAWGAMRLHALQVLRAPKAAFRRMMPSLVGIAGCGAALAWWLGTAGAPRVVLLWGVVALVAVLCERLAVAAGVAGLTRQGRFERRAAVVGGGPPGADLLEILALQSDPDLRVLGVFDDRNDARSPMILAGYPKLGSVADLVTFARRTRIDVIIFTLPITAEDRLLQMLKKLWVLPTDIRLAAHRSGLRFRPKSYSYVGGVPVLDMFDKPIADWDVIVKAIFDRIVGALALVALSPVLLLTALAIKLDSRGPVFFKQLRHGFNNEPVEVYKFRSLFADQTDFAAAKQVTRNDPRVTRVGRFIRKTSLDELPQLLNVVLKGNLSLVGPRPHALQAHLANKAYADVVDGYFARHKVKPGITGWAQVNGWRGETDTPVKIQKRVEHDLAYIENWSIFFDMYILAITPWALTRTENAF
ncbi:undecaprenyl-phosphate glucose phosphotransferase [Lichenihabitans sp. Uapishka_5]|uniref:undecaprenyl-phosphate glucose phosphotransferase n=1 Tax=Lichenihabitans sp. Uapishka_5 TaxID=3037302 RepID=UPI0029E825C3|nr:undecaprenyl-phosphate glucose phosphotransferase [Lichenihabitans sp. Uapishka_5]MDX7949848.1 undecaprenyl-phosphate glucose phosphotransferase [Lichenihabitans sp. Uapishka_5]